MDFERSITEKAVGGCVAVTVLQLKSRYYLFTVDFSEVFFDGGIHGGSSSFVVDHQAEPGNKAGYSGWSG